MHTPPSVFFCFLRDKMKRRILDFGFGFFRISGICGIYASPVHTASLGFLNFVLKGGFWKVVFGVLNFILIRGFGTFC